MKTHLWQCETFAEQKAWCLAQFEAGITLSELSIWLGGAEPGKIVRALRRAGLRLKTCRVTIIDTEGTVHPKTLAWRVEPHNAKVSGAGTDYNYERKTMYPNDEQFKETTEGA